MSEYYGRYSGSVASGGIGRGITTKTAEYQPIRPLLPSRLVGVLLITLTDTLPPHSSVPREEGLSYLPFPLCLPFPSLPPLNLFGLSCLPCLYHPSSIHLHCTPVTLFSPRRSFNLFVSSLPSFPDRPHSLVATSLPLC
jgi:hypothetical protein